MTTAKKATKKSSAKAPAAPVRIPWPDDTSMVDMLIDDYFDGPGMLENWLDRGDIEEVPLSTIAYRAREHVESVLIGQARSARSCAVHQLHEAGKLTCGKEEALAILEPLWAEELAEGLATSMLDRVNFDRVVEHWLAERAAKRGAK